MALLLPIALVGLILELLIAMCLIKILDELRKP